MKDESIDIEKDKNSLPLSFKEVVFKEVENNSENSVYKTTISNKYNDANYSIYKFYKPISRF